MCWQLCVCIHLSHLFKFSVRSFFQLPLPAPPLPGRRRLTVKQNGGLPLMTSFQRLRGDDGVMTCVRTTPCFYVGLCEPGGSRACQRATVTPLLLHHSQFTTKHPHRSVRAYLWGDCKMSMEFGPHCTDLKTLSGTFRTTNGFQWYMTSALSCFSSL